MIQTVINPLRAVGSSKLCVRVLFCARIASGVVFEYTKSDKKIRGGEGGSDFEQFQVLTMSFRLTRQAKFI